MPNSVQQFLFTVLVTLTSRFFVLRDWLLGGPRSIRMPAVGNISRHSIESGRNLLDAVLVMPDGRPAAALLICHGIGETVENWRQVQQLLAGHGVASLVFDYSGYGRSTGRVRAAQCEQDAVAAFHYLQELTPGVPVSLLGFSLGSGIATDVLPRLPVHRLVLCSAYTSFREAVACVHLPGILAPAIWDTQSALRHSLVPVLIMHSENDRLFPVQMALDLRAAAGDAAHVVIAPGTGHDTPYYRPDRTYWGTVSAHVLSKNTGAPLG